MKALSELNDHIVASRKNIQIYFSKPTVYIQDLNANVLRNVWMKGMLTVLRNKERWKNFIQQFGVFNVKSIINNKALFEDGQIKDVNFVPIIKSTYTAVNTDLILAGVSACNYVPTVNFCRAKVIALIYLTNDEIDTYLRDFLNEKTFSLMSDEISVDLKQEIADMINLIDKEKMPSENDMTTIKQYVKKWSMQGETHD